MYLKRLGLEHFRCYEQLRIDFGPGLHVLVGGNASGKTSILEAIHLLAVTRSHRTSSDRELIAWDQDWARVTGAFCTRQRQDVMLRVTLRHRREASATDDRVPRKSVEVNSVPRRRLADIIGQTAVVLFGPDDLALIKGPPSVRRHFLNAGISQVRAAYLSDVVRYRQALRQRNASLKTIQTTGSGRELLSSWDGPLVEAGASVSGARAEFVQGLAAHMQELHHELSGGGEQIEIEYKGDLAEALDVSSKQRLMREILAENVERDIDLGRTLSGPHRDEVEVRIGDRPLRDFGSQGQQRTAALSLTLAEARVIEEWADESPVVLLDDCLSELDEERARRVLGLTESVEQMIITTTSWDRVLDEFAGSARVLEIGGRGARERVSDGNQA